MKTFLSVCTIILTSSLLFAAPPESRPVEKIEWSAAVNGLQAKLTLVEKAKDNGTRQIYVYLELRNVRDLAHPLKVPLDEGHVKFQLLDGTGEGVRDGWSLRRSGPHADPGVVSLPVDSEMKIGMHCTNWGVSKDAAAHISTDSGAWVLKPEDNGKVYLRAILRSDLKEDHPDNLWKGVIVAPPVKVNWAE